MMTNLRRRQLLVAAGAAAVLRPALLRGQGTADLPTVTLPGEFDFPLENPGDGKVEFRVEVVHPPTDFDASAARPEELERFGLPPRPRERDTLAHWEGLMRRVRFLPVIQNNEVLAQLGTVRSSISTLSGMAAPSAGGSDNWCGAYVRTIGMNRLTAVAGKWTVPDRDCHPPIGLPPIVQPPHLECRASQWIGLDGSDPTSRSLPQIGSMRTLPKGIYERQLWWQWWIAKALGQKPIHIPGLQLDAGDEVTGRLRVIDPTKMGYSFLVDHQPSSPVMAVNFYVSATYKGNFTGSLGVEGRVAEWIVERPMMRRHGRREARLYPMPVITPVTFSGCRATMSNGEDLDLHRAPLLRIQDWDEFLPLGQRICEVEDKTDDGFVAKYIGPPAQASGPCFT